MTSAKCLLLLPLLLAATTSVAMQLEIIYIPGWLKAQAAHPEVEQVLKRIFPNASVRTLHWDGNGLWQTALENADKLAEALADELTNRPPQERERIVLVGHSLGGRITAKCLAKLATRDVKLHGAILMAAAIPCGDKSLDVFTQASMTPVVNIVNPNDVTLKYFYGTVGGESQTALGASGSLRPLTNALELVVPKDFIQKNSVPDPLFDNVIVKTFANHHVIYYIEYLDKLHKGDINPNDLPVAVPQDMLNIKLPVLDAGIWWNTLEICNGWQLQQHILTEHCRILDDTDTRRAWGSLKTLQPAFKKLVLKWVQNPRERTLPFDPFNPKEGTTVLNERVFWNVIQDYQGWELQQHIITGHARIVDPQDKRRAFGPFLKMKDFFFLLIQQLKAKKTEAKEHEP